MPAPHQSSAEPKNVELCKRLLRDACAKLGDEQALAHHLGVPTRVLNLWLRGSGRPTDSVFLKCVDLLEDSRQRGYDHRGRDEGGRLNASRFQANRASMIVYSWCVMDRYAGSEAARRMPRWKMTEAEAASWAARAGVEVVKIEGSEETLRAPSAPGKDGC